MKTVYSIEDLKQKESDQMNNKDNEIKKPVEIKKGNWYSFLTVLVDRRVATILHDDVNKGVGFDGVYTKHFAFNSMVRMKKYRLATSEEISIVKSLKEFKS